jgi:hypothetical protein
MKLESLHALLIDRELGELSPEALELLEAWLAEHPETSGPATSIRRTLETASATVRRFPQLSKPETNIVAFESLRSRLVPLALAASIFILLGGTAWFAYRAGDASARKAVQIERPTPPSANTVKQGGPWARYALASAPNGGLTVSRRD